MTTIARILVLIILLFAFKAYAQDRPPGGDTIYEAQTTSTPVGNDTPPPIDPTANVIALSEAAARRQDDLREASERFILARIEAESKLQAIIETKNKELREAESRRVDGEARLRADFQSQLAAAEAKRIDAIRTVDVNAVQTATDRTSGQAAVLAEQVSGTAETQRAAVATTSQGFIDAMERLEITLSSRIAALEAKQNVGEGRQTVSDPALAAALEEIKAIRLAQSASKGEDTGSSETIAFILAGIGALVGLIGLGVAMLRPRKGAVA